MRGAVIYGKGDVRFEEREDPRILEPSDAVVRTVATCVCGSDLWRYRGINEVPEPTPIGHEYVGVVEEVGDAVRGVKPGEFVVGGFRTSDNTCPVCRKGAHANCQNGTGYDGCQAEKIRVPNADGTLVAIPGEVGRDLVPSLRELTEGIGADGVVEAVGTASARDQAALCVRPGGMIGVVGVPHGGLKDDGLFFRNVGVWGGIAPVRRYLDQLVPLVVDRKINPGRVFDLQLPLADVAEAYAAMDERRATKVLLWP